MSENRVTKESIEAKIIAVGYVVLPGSTVTVCMITLQNGYSVRGESACVDPANFDKALGEQYAYEDAFRKIWPLEGYLLKERLYIDQKIQKPIRLGE